MYIKYDQKIWLTKEIITKTKGKTTYEYKLYKNLAEITGKQNAKKWINNYYSDKNSNLKISKFDHLVIELFSTNSTQFFLIIPKSYKTSELKLRYVNITNYIIN